MSIVQHGDVLFTNLFVYDANGAPIWYVMPSGSWNASHTAFHGNVYLPKGSPSFAYDVSKFNIGAALGSATIAFADANTATFDYTISGASGHKDITRIPFGPDGPPTDQPMGDSVGRHRGERFRAGRPAAGRRSSCCGSLRCQWQCGLVRDAERVLGARNDYRVRSSSAGLRGFMFRVAVAPHDHRRRCSASCSAATRRCSAYAHGTRAFLHAHSF
jgi:hypothetical protein